MPSVCIYFEVHQPMRLNRFSVFNIGTDNGHPSNYFNHQLNKQIFEKVAHKCYLPTNNLLLDLIKQNKGKFKIRKIDKFLQPSYLYNHAQKMEPFHLHQ